MKGALIVFILFLSFGLFAQISFESNTSKPRILYSELKGTILEVVAPDSIEFELRYWSGINESRIFLQLTYSKEGIWSFRTGFFMTNSEELVVFEKSRKAIGFGDLWKELLELNILTYEQSESGVFQFAYETHTVKMIPKAPQSSFTIKTDTTDHFNHAIELFTKYDYRVYGYAFLNKNDYSEDGKLESNQPVFFHMIRILDKRFSLSNTHRDYYNSQASFVR